jgi:hypothetical protein
LTFVRYCLRENSKEEHNEHMFTAGCHDLRPVLLVKFMTLCCRIGVFGVSYPCSMEGVKDISVVDVLTIAFQAAKIENRAFLYNSTR